MRLLHPICTGEDRRADAARLLAHAMEQDMEAQRELILARASGETDAVYHASFDSGIRELMEERRCLREQVQCTMIRAHLAIEKAAAEVARAKALLAASRRERAAIFSRLQK